MRALVTDDAGQDLLEYALLVGLIALVAVVAVTATGTSVKNVFNDVATKIKVPAAP
jgi:pilus assembly protein Flp/PilA